MPTEAELLAFCQCPQCGALASERDPFRGDDGKIDVTRSFVMYECGNYTGSGYFGKVSCDMGQARKALSKALSALLGMVRA